MAKNLSKDITFPEEGPVQGHFTKDTGPDRVADRFHPYFGPVTGTGFPMNESILRPKLSSEMLQREGERLQAKLTPKVTTITVPAARGGTSLSEILGGVGDQSPIMGTKTTKTNSWTSPLLTKAEAEAEIEANKQKGLAIGEAEKKTVGIYEQERERLAEQSEYLKTTTDISRERAKKAVAAIKRIDNKLVEMNKNIDGSKVNSGAMFERMGNFGAVLMALSMMSSAISSEGEKPAFSAAQISKGINNAIEQDVADQTAKYNMLRDKLADYKGDKTAALARLDKAELAVTNGMRAMGANALAHAAIQTKNVKDLLTYSLAVHSLKRQDVASTAKTRGRSSGSKVTVEAPMKVEKPQLFKTQAGKVFDEARGLATTVKAWARLKREILKAQNSVGYGPKSGWAVAQAYKKFPGVIGAVNSLAKVMATDYGRTMGEKGVMTDRDQKRVEFAGILMRDTPAALDYKVTHARGAARAKAAVGLKQLSTLGVSNAGILKHARFLKSTGLLGK